MENTPIIVEGIYKAPISKIWKAITEKEEMKQWYFDLAEFKAEAGFEFRFTGGPDGGIQYLHICKVTEVIQEQKLSYSWRYDGYEGISFVSFELFDGNGSTRVKLTHSGLESFPADNPDFAKENFEEGWKEIIGTSLKEYLEKQG